LEGANIARLVSDYHDHFGALQKERERKMGEIGQSQELRAKS
jgi:hypothetical protein